MTETVVWYVYLLECRGGRIYTGITPRLAARMRAHRAGRGARFTRMHKPQRLLAAKAFASRGEALRAEYEVKRISPARKRELAAQWSAAHPVEDCLADGSADAMAGDGHNGGADEWPATSN